MADLQTFRASTMPDAYNAVKQALGNDALILHTRSIVVSSWLGLRRQNVIEITAKRHVPVRASAIRKAAAAPTLNSPAAAYARNSNAASAGLAASVAARPASKPALAKVANIEPASIAGVLNTPVGNQLMLKVFAEEVSGLRGQMKELLGEVRKGGTRTADVRIEGELASHYDALLDAGLSPELAEGLLKSVRMAVPAGYLGNKPFVSGKVAEQLERLLTVSGPIKRTKKAGPHIVALIGPTGVGKTTTLAKLAADLQLRNRQRVGLITLDTYRIAAVDQLRRYAEIIGSPLKVVSSPAELPAAIASLGDVDYVLIDTAGRSPRDSMKLSELRSYLDAARPDEVHLVLSAVGEARSIDLAVAAFSKVRVDRLLFTKIDEAANLGVVVNTARSAGKPLSYLTTGQDVPDDIEVARARNIAARIVSGGVASSIENERRADGPLGGQLALAGGIQ